MMAMMLCIVGIFAQTKNGGISEELLERVKNKLSPKWCKFRLEKEQKKKEEII